MGCVSLGDDGAHVREAVVIEADDAYLLADDIGSRRVERFRRYATASVFFGLGAASALTGERAAAPSR